MIERILLADDHSIVRLGLSILIKKLRPQAIIEEVANYSGVLSIIKKQKFDLIILDINMPDGNFQDTLALIKIKQPEVKVLVFTSQDEQAYAIRYLKMGADGFLHKLAPDDVLKEALGKVLDQGTYMSEEVKDNLIHLSLQKKNVLHDPIALLSAREMEVAQRLIKGEGTKEISNGLNLHASTVSTYKNRVFVKLEIESIPELIDLFRFYGITSQ